MGEACALERESLEAIYMDDFVAISPSEWMVTIVEGVALRVKVPESYPLSLEPPGLGVECSDSRFDEGSLQAFARRLQCQWQPRADEQWIVMWAQDIREHVSGAPPEVPGPGAAASGGLEADGSLEPPAASRGTTVRVSFGGGSASIVGQSLQAAGFQDCSAGAGTTFVHASKGLTVELFEAMQITVDGVDAEDMEEWAALQLAEDASCFGARLAEWTAAQRSEGFLPLPDEDPEGGRAAGGDLRDWLPDPQEHGVQRERRLTVYTWGKALRKAAPKESQCNFNAGILNGRGGGADLRTMNGKSEEVQRNVASCGLFPRWLEMVLSKIEKSTPPLHTISINCTKGRHRSVAAAEILSKYYYPNASVVHLTIS